MTVALAFLAASILTGVSPDDLRKEFPTYPGDRVIVADAMKRKIADAGGSAKAAEAVTENIVPIVIHFPDKRCVVLRWPAGTMVSGGGDDIYCYRVKTDKPLEYYLSRDQ